MLLPLGSAVIISGKGIRGGFNEYFDRFSCDNNYVRFLATAMTSILFNAAKDDYFYFYIMDGGIKNEEKLKIEELQSSKNFSLKYIDVENFEKLNLLYLPSPYHFSKAAYARLFIADYLPTTKKSYLS